MGLNTNSRRRQNAPGRTEWKSYKRWLNRTQPKSIQAQGQLFVGCCCETAKKKKKEKKKVNACILWYSEKKNRAPSRSEWITEVHHTATADLQVEPSMLQVWLHRDGRAGCKPQMWTDVTLECCSPPKQGLWCCCWHHGILVTESVPQMKRLRCNAAPTGCSLCNFCPLEVTR